MNAVEIEQAVSELAEKSFDAREFPFAFLEAFGRKAVTIKKLRSGDSNRSDLGGVLQTGHIHILAAAPGAVSEAFQALKASPATARAKARFVLATDGATLEAEDLQSDDPSVVCDYRDFPDRFAAFLPLAGITTVRQVRESSFDIRATGRLNKLYLELRRFNPDWDRAERRPDMNHFLARLIFCFFAQSTDIFLGEGLFSNTVAQMTARDGSDAHEVIETVFRAMSMTSEEKASVRLPRWAESFPRVNGWLFSGDMAVPRFNGIARSYLLHIGGLDWRKINPDIFGSMIQAVADDDERGALGMHYTSVPNILKVLNPLFLDDLQTRLEEAGDNARTLLNLRRRMARIRVFDPACGSGNFLVIAYKEMRAIEAEIDRRRGEEGERTAIPLTNFRGIEIKNFSAEVARLALIIAEFQCDVRYRGQKEALREFLPLGARNWITCGNALRLDWSDICPSIASAGNIGAGDLFSPSPNPVSIDLDEERGEIYVCGNPPYLGNKLQSEQQKSDLKEVFEGRTEGWKSLDYVAAWLMKAADFGTSSKTASAFVTTNSVCQGQQVPILWPSIYAKGHEIGFAHTSFKWANLASHNAGVIVIIVGITSLKVKTKRIFSQGADGTVQERTCPNINPYLVAGQNVIVEASREAPRGCAPMLFGNMPRDGGNLLVSPDEKAAVKANDPVFRKYLRRFVGSEDLIHSNVRYCLWITDGQRSDAINSGRISDRLEAVRVMRLASKAGSTREFARLPHRFVQIQGTARQWSIVIPRHSSERREYLPIGLLDPEAVIADSAFAIYDAPLWMFSLLISRLHLSWVAAVCGKLKTDYRYSNTIGWNTFPIPVLTEKNQENLDGAAKDILQARESYYPATIGDMYDPDNMDNEYPLLRSAHDKNDDIIDRIYVGRRLRNDTDRLETLFRLYSERATSAPKQNGSKRRARGQGCA